MLRPEYPIETDRLTLRPFTRDDLDDLYAYLSRPDVVRYLYIEPRDRAETRVLLDRDSQRTSIEKSGDGIKLGVVSREAGRLVGHVSLVWLSEEHQQGEIGFVFNPDYHGRGYATEAARVMMRLGFDGLKLHRIVGRCDARNDASARVMRRLGMRSEAEFVENEFVKGEWTGELVYAILAREFPG